MTTPFDFSNLPRTPKEETAELARRMEMGELPETVDAELFARRNGRRLLAWHAAKGGCLPPRFVDKKLLDRTLDGGRYVANALIERRTLSEEHRNHLMRHPEQMLRMALFGCLPSSAFSDDEFLDSRVEERTEIASEVTGRVRVAAKGSTMRMLAAGSGTLPVELLEGRLEDRDSEGRTCAHYAASGGLLPRIGRERAEKCLHFRDKRGGTAAHALAESPSPPEEFFSEEILRLADDDGTTVAHVCASNLFLPPSLASEEILSLGRPGKTAVAHLLLLTCTRSTEEGGDSPALRLVRRVPGLLRALRSEHVLNLLRKPNGRRFRCGLSATTAEDALSTAALLSRLGLLEEEDVAKMNLRTTEKEDVDVLAEMMRKGRFNRAHLSEEILSRKGFRWKRLEHAAAGYGLLGEEYFAALGEPDARSILDAAESGSVGVDFLDGVVAAALGRGRLELVRDAANIRLERERRGRASGNISMEELLDSALRAPCSAWSLADRCVVAAEILFGKDGDGRRFALEAAERAGGKSLILSFALENEGRG